MAAGDAAESELLALSSAVDLLCGPVPSCLPSPQLHPHPVLLNPADLINFEEKPSTGELPSTKCSRVCPTFRISWLFFFLFGGGGGVASVLVAF